MSTTSVTTEGKTPNGKKANGTRAGLKEHTDRSRWRLLDEDGRQTWHYLEDDKKAEAWPQSFADKYFLSLPTVSVRPYPSIASH
jgi:lanosterol synthase